MNSTEFTPQIFLKDLNTQDFLTFGVEQMAYVRPTIIDEREVFAIHAADGMPLYIVESRSEAMAVIHRNDLDALTLQ